MIRLKYNELRCAPPGGIERLLKFYGMGPPTPRGGESAGEYRARLIKEFMRVEKQMSDGVKIDPLSGKKKCNLSTKEV